MKAIAIKEAGIVVPMETTEPQMGPADVMIDVCYVGLCGSDLNSYRGLMPLVTFPRIPGHEISGKVLLKGAEVPDSIKIGDLATVSPYTSCGVCPACKAGRENTCENNKTFGVQRDGAITERIVVPFEKVFVSKILTLQELALVEPLSVGYHATNRGRVNEQDTVLVFGCGAIGMGAVCASVRKGATVIAVDVDDTKLESARVFGATYVINGLKEDVKKRVAEITNNEGVSIAIEAVGNGETFRQAIASVCFSGRVVMIGYAKGETSLDTQLIIKKELDVLGSRNALRVFPAVIKMLERREKPFANMITRIYPFDETPKALKDWSANTGIVSKFLIDIKA
jgi:threonine dehydrogenase-like Zn-dependent dehydrogenase